MSGRKIRGGRTADYVLSQIQESVRKFQIANFEHYQLQVFVHPLADSHKENLKRGGLRCRAFDIEINGDPMSVPVTLDRDGEIVVWHRRRWTHISQLLSSSLPSRPIYLQAECAQGPLSHYVKQSLWDQQSYWWDSNGKVFRFFGLPSEIREQIYALLFTGMIYPYPYARCRRITRLRALSLWRQNPSIKAVACNRRFCEEASHVLYAQAVFYIDSIGILARIMKSRAFQQLRNVSIALSREAYTNLFGDGSSEHRANSKFHPAAEALRLICLKSLRITINPPDEDDLLTHLYCHKVVCARIFRAAFPYIKCQPIQVQGCIDPEQKYGFERRCALTRRRFEAWVKLGPLGCKKGVPAEYDEWEASNGGVTLVDDLSLDTALDDLVAISDEEYHCEEPCLNRFRRILIQESTGMTIQPNWL